MSILLYPIWSIGVAMVFLSIKFQEAVHMPNNHWHIIKSICHCAQIKRIYQPSGVYRLWLHNDITHTKFWVVLGYHYVTRCLNQLKTETEVRYQCNNHFDQFYLKSDILTWCYDIKCCKIAMRLLCDRIKSDIIDL